VPSGLPLFPQQASTGAGRVDLLYFFLVATSGIITIAIFACLLYFCARYRRRPGNEVAEQVTGTTRLEITWTLIPLGLAMIPFLWGATLFMDMSRPPDDALDISVVARQWMWKAEHPDGQEEINELHVPVGRPVRLTMTSQDVIHSFFVPAFRAKTDVLPGRYTTVWFEPTEPGTYHLFCAEYCGTDHSGMTGWVTVLEPADYERWLGEAATESTASQGLKLFQQYGCISCHRADSLRRGPVIEGLFGQPVLLEGGQTVIADENYLRESILNPNAKVVSGYQPIMPTFQGQLSEEQMFALIAYIKAVGPQPGSPPPRPRPVPSPLPSPSGSPAR
jgi:cytochrome c oxidase subunit 2